VKVGLGVILLLVLAIIALIVIGFLLLGSFFDQFVPPGVR
jgi:hypothetical protein